MSEIYAVDPSGRAPVAQVTFGRPASCDDAVPPYYRHLVTLACGYIDPLPSPDGRRVLYREVPSPYLHSGSALWIARADGSAARLFANGVDGASWSPDSRLIAYRQGGGVHIATVNRSQSSVLVDGALSGGLPHQSDAFRASYRAAGLGVGDPAWSPDGRWLAVPTSAVTTKVERVGRLRMIFLRTRSQPAWAPDSRRVAYADPGHDFTDPRHRVWVVTLPGMAEREVGVGEAPAWSPDGRSLAFESGDGIRIFSVGTSKTRLLTRDARFQPDECAGYAVPLPLGWAPDGRSLAYLPGYSDDLGCGLVSGDVRVVTLTGQLRSVVPADRQYGGRMLSFAWTRPAAGVRYRRAVTAPAERVSTDGILADGPVEFLAADGGRVAFSTGCGTVSTWTPAQPSEAAMRGGQGSHSQRVCQVVDSGEGGVVDGLAIAGTGVAWVEVCCHNSKEWALYEQTFETPSRRLTLGSGRGGADIAGPADSGSHVDSPAGAGPLLVFSSWQSALNPATSHYDVIQQSIVRAGAAGCPCTTLRTDPGPLIIDDVDAGHIAAHGTNGFLVLDGNGAQLSFIAVKPAAAALSGADLVMLVQGELRDYDWSSGTLMHSWPLPNVPAGPDCPFGIAFGCPGEDRAELPLRLQDAARGLIAYILDDQVHLLRLADGKGATVARGNHARFMNTGLVYAYGSRIHLVPFEQLPLR